MSRTGCELRGFHKWVVVMNTDPWRPEAVQCGDWECGAHIPIPPPDELDVDQALAVLAAAGWTIREDRDIGRLVPGIEPPLLAVACGYDPENQHFSRTVAQEHWKPVADG